MNKLHYFLTLLIINLVWNGACNSTDKEINPDRKHTAEVNKFQDENYHKRLIDTILHFSGINFNKIIKGNMIFYFEPGKYPEKNFERLSTDAIESRQHCLQLINSKFRDDNINVIYFDNREKLRPYLNMAPKGYAIPSASTLLIATNDSTRAYHTHELMHIVSIQEFGGYATSPADWIQEGLAVFADNPCAGYPIHAIAANMLYEGNMPPIDSLLFQFRNLPDMQGYMYAGSLVQYIIENYGLEKFVRLWKEGARNCMNIFDKDPDALGAEFRTFLSKTYPQQPAINWQQLQVNGCG